MSETLCICCYGQITDHDGEPLYLKAPADGAEGLPVAWAHSDCLVDYTSPFVIADFPESDLAALREHARALEQQPE